MVLDGDLLWVYEKSGKLLMKVKRSPNRLYKFTVADNESICLLTKTEDAAWL